MKKVAILYASHDGHTKTICETIQSQLHAGADLLDVAQCDADTIANYDVLILGSAIRYGRHLKPMVDYLRTHKDALADKQTAFFSVNLTARKPHRNTPETSRYVQKLLKRLDWQPDALDVFAGKINYPHYGFFDKQIIRFIMWLTDGPTDGKTVQVFTDWQRVADFSERLNALISASTPSPAPNNTKADR